MQSKKSNSNQEKTNDLTFTLYIRDNVNDTTIIQKDLKDLKSCFNFVKKTLQSPKESLLKEFDALFKNSDVVQNSMENGSIITYQTQDKNSNQMTIEIYAKSQKEKIFPFEEQLTQDQIESDLLFSYQEEEEETNNNKYYSIETCLTKYATIEAFNKFNKAPISKWINLNVKDLNDKEQIFEAITEQKETNEYLLVDFDKNNDTPKEINQKINILIDLLKITLIKEGPEKGLYANPIKIIALDLNDF